jgi:hypothetical protein
MREHWKYLGAWTALGIDPTVNGQRCYWFRRENVGKGGTTRVIPVKRYWGR